MRTDSTWSYARRLVLAGLLSLLATGCATGGSGWFRIDPRNGPFYGGWLSPSPLSGDMPPCESLTSHLTAGDHPLYVFVHGYGGDNGEWHAIPTLLESTHPAAMFMFRWSANGNREQTESLLAAGVSHLLACFAGRAHPVLLLAHSAGGLVASYAQSRIIVPAGATLPAVYVVTVASPLAMSQTMSLGTLPAEAKGVRVAHLRTSYPADPHMKPDDGRLPNDPSVGVAGARQIDLPPDVNHDGSILYAAQRFADGTWKEWFDAR
jgi:pimeloyl-ACP methyl ester carboxylesterase